MSKEVKHSYLLMKRKVYLSPLILFIFFIFLTPQRVFGGKILSTEEKWKDLQTRIQLFDQHLSLSQKNLLRHASAEDLSPHLKILRDQKIDLLKEREALEDTLRLKKMILTLDESSISPYEADLAAQTTIQTFEETKKKFSMIRPAGLNNIFVNMKLKNDGLCWHWARELLFNLNKQFFKTIEYHWVTAYEGKLREHNAIAIYPKGKSFKEGVVLDGWRKSGKPYWNLVSLDHYPWEIGNYEEDHQNDQNQN